MPRRMIQRAFLSLLEENRSRFAIEIKHGRRNDSVQQFAFAGINSAISGVLSTYEISVFVMHQGACWDFLLDVDTEPRPVPGGYVCDLCPSEPRPVFPNRPALCADSDEAGHQFRKEAGHRFRFEAGRDSDLMPATQRSLPRIGAMMYRRDRSVKRAPILGLRRPRMMVGS